MQHNIQFLIIRFKYYVQKSSEAFDYNEATSKWPPHDLVGKRKRRNGGDLYSAFLALNIHTIYYILSALQRDGMTFITLVNAQVAVVSLHRGIPL